MDRTGIDQEELNVFLQEADEQLQLLDEDIIRLEKEADNVDLLQEIFRAAHTLKGSSGMLGFRDMAELTHHMEDVLDRLRKGQLPVTSELVDALLGSLDGLKELMLHLNSGDEGEVDVSDAVAALRAVAGAGTPHERARAGADHRGGRRRRRVDAAPRRSRARRAAAGATSCARRLRPIRRGRRYAHSRP